MAFILYDVAVVAVLLFFLWRGWKRGLLLSLCGLAVAVVSFLGAGFLADTLDSPMADAIQPKLASAIEENLSDYMAPHSDDPSPADPIDGLREMGGLYEWVADALDETRTGVDSAVLDTVQGVAHDAAQTIAVQIAHTVIFALAFVVLFVLLTLLLHALNVVAKLPGLNFCNGLGGGLIGLVKGIVILFVAIACLRLFSGLITPEVEENTYVMRLFLRLDPVSVLLRA